MEKTATIIVSTEKGYADTIIFGTETRKWFYVKGFADGIALLNPLCGTNISEFAEVVAGCFDEESNFWEILNTCFESENENELSEIKFEFNDVTVSVTKENADPEWIVKEWNRLEDEEYERWQKEQEEYHKTWEYKLKHAKELKRAYRAKEVEAKIEKIAQETEIEFKDDEAKTKWEGIVEINSHDSYGSTTCKYAEYWVKFMQHLMATRGAELEKIAEETSNAADMFGMSGFTYGCAVSMICQCWKYGEELRRWHNKQWGAPEDAEGVVNPAVLCIAVAE
jgi:hypothetical protein